MLGEFYHHSQLEGNTDVLTEAITHTSVFVDVNLWYENMQTTDVFNK